MDLFPTTAGQKGEEPVLPPRASQLRIQSLAPASMSHLSSTQNILLRPNPKKNMGPYARVDYNLTLFPLQSRLQHINHWQPYARVDLKGAQA
jgi:hypothetical protein